MGKGVWVKRVDGEVLFWMVVNVDMGSYGIIGVLGDLVSVIVVVSEWEWFYRFICLVELFGKD